MGRAAMIAHSFIIIYIILLIYALNYPPVLPRGRAHRVAHGHGHVSPIMPCQFARSHGLPLISDSVVVSRYRQADPIVLLPAAWMPFAPDRSGRWELDQSVLEVLFWV